MTTYKTDAEIPAVWKVGDVILDELEVREVLGRGGMGVVYPKGHNNIWCIIAGLRWSWR